MATEFKFASGRARAEREQARKARQEEYERARKAREEQDRAWRERTRSRYYSSYASSSGVPAQDKAMALEIINAGLRALTRKHHPDLGGSHDQMVAVNRAVEALRKVVS